MSAKENSTSAFPVPGLQKFRELFGMRLREHAAIELRVPDSGIPWLDQMILASKRDELAGDIVKELIREASDTDLGMSAVARAALVKEAFVWADSILEARR